MMTFCTMIASASYVTPVFAADSSTSKEAKAYTTPIKGVNSISLLEKVSIGGTNQWITVRGEDRRNPILLYLHGGPGHAEMGSNPRFKELEKRYVVVNWDQRGSGKSFSPNLSKETLNVDQFLSDTHEMVEMLKKRFGRERIYLVGHSWGSLLGMIEISRHPESFYAYVGVGQFVDVTQGDRMGYDYTLNKAREVGNVAAIKELEGIGPPPYDSFDTFLAYRKWLIAMGGVFYSPTYIQDVMIPDIRNASEYTEAEKENHEMGEGLLTSTVIPELPEYNLLNQIHEVKVPVYFVAGKADYNTPLKLVEKLNEQLVAPHKELFLFEKSGHAPNYEEEQKFAQIMNQYVFNKTYYNPVADKPVRILLNGKDVNLKHELSDGQLHASSASYHGRARSNYKMGGCYKYRSSDDRPSEGHFDAGLSGCQIR